METQVTQNADSEPQPAPENFSGWLFFNNALVLVQFKEPYLIASYGSHAVQTDPHGNARAMPAMNGVLRVLPDGLGGVMLVLDRNMSKDEVLPRPDADLLRMTIHPDNVAFVSMILEAPKSSIIPP